jgi:hypothetical protein
MQEHSVAREALKAVPVRNPAEDGRDYALRLRLWALTRPNVYQTAAALMCAAADSVDLPSAHNATHKIERKDTDILANGQSRASHRTTMREVMRKRRAAAKQAATHNIDNANNGVISDA